MSRYNSSRSYGDRPGGGTTNADYEQGEHNPPIRGGFVQGTSEGYNDQRGAAMKRGRGSSNRQFRGQTQYRGSAAEGSREYSQADARSFGGPSQATAYDRSTDQRSGQNTGRTSYFHASCLWEYKDPEGVSHGGHTARQILKWWRQGWFNEHTEVRCIGNWAPMQSIQDELAAMLDQPHTPSAGFGATFDPRGHDGQSSDRRGDYGLRQVNGDQPGWPGSRPDGRGPRPRAGGGQDDWPGAQGSGQRGGGQRGDDRHWQGQDIDPSSGHPNRRGAPGPPGDSQRLGGPSGASRNPRQGQGQGQTETVASIVARALDPAHGPQRRGQRGRDGLDDRSASSHAVDFDNHRQAGGRRGAGRDSAPPALPQQPPPPPFRGDETVGEGGSEPKSKRSKKRAAEPRVAVDPAALAALVQAVTPEPFAAGTSTGGGSGERQGCIWRYIDTDSNKARGPFSSEQLADLTTAGQVDAHTRVCAIEQGAVRMMPHRSLFRPLGELADSVLAGAKYTPLTAQHIEAATAAEEEAGRVAAGHEQGARRGRGKGAGAEAKGEGKAEAKSEGRVEGKNEPKADGKGDGRVEGKGPAKGEGKSDSRGQGKGEGKAVGAKAEGKGPKGEGRGEGKAEGKASAKADFVLDGKAEGKGNGRGRDGSRGPKDGKGGRARGGGRIRQADVEEKRAAMSLAAGAIAAVLRGAGEDSAAQQVEQRLAGALASTVAADTAAAVAGSAAASVPASGVGGAGAGGGNGAGGGGNGKRGRGRGRNGSSQVVQQAATAVDVGHIDAAPLADSVLADMAVGKAEASAPTEGEGASTTGDSSAPPKSAVALKGRRGRHAAKGESQPAGDYGVVVAKADSGDAATGASGGAAYARVDSAGGAIAPAAGSLAVAKAAEDSGEGHSGSLVSPTASAAKGRVPSVNTTIGSLDSQKAGSVQDVVAATAAAAVAGAVARAVEATAAVPAPTPSIVPPAQTAPSAKGTESALEPKVEAVPAVGKQAVGEANSVSQAVSMGPEADVVDKQGKGKKPADDEKKSGACKQQ